MGGCCNRKEEENNGEMLIPIKSFNNIKDIEPIYIKYMEYMSHRSKDKENDKENKQHSSISIFLHKVIKIQSVYRGMLYRKILKVTRLSLINNLHQLENGIILSKSNTTTTTKQNTHIFKCSSFKPNTKFTYENKDSSALLLKVTSSYIDYLTDKQANNIFHRFGIISWKDGTKYIGNFSNNRANGFGIQVLKNKTYYYGEWMNDKTHGYGIYKESNGSYYKGEWENDVQSGFGIEYTINYGTYIGEFKNGKKEGIGKLTLDDGSIYMGEFKENQINGLGKFDFKDNKVYYGEWVNNTMNGYGKLTISYSKSYEGYFSNNKKEGFGVFHSEGKYFFGIWKNDCLDGEVCIINKNKEIINSLWKDGKRLKLLCNKSFYSQIAEDYICNNYFLSK